MPSVRQFYKFLWENAEVDSIKFSDNGLDSTVTADITVTSNNLNFLTSCNDAYIFEPSSDDSIEAGRKISIIRNSNHVSEEGVFLNYKQPLLSLDFETINNETFYLADINCEIVSNSESKSEEHEQVQLLFFIAKAVKILLETKDYKAGSKLIFFGKDTLELPLELNESFFTNLEISTILSETNFDVLESFSQWFFSNDSEKHQGNKKAILKTAMLDVLLDMTKEQRLYAFLCNLHQIARQTMRSYELYLEDFKYSRFSKKLEEKRIEYFEKITKVVLDVRNQVIGLPVVFILLNLAKQDGNFSFFALVGILSYSLILLVILAQQLTYISDIENEINNFSSQATDSQTIRSELIEMKEKLEKRLNRQKSIISFFQLLIILATVTSIIQFFYFN